MKREETICRCLQLPVRDVAFGYRADAWPADPLAAESFAICCRSAWAEAASAANWMTTRFASHEPPHDGKGRVGDFAPDMKAIREEGRGLFPGLDSQVFYDLLRRTLKSYGDDQWQVFTNHSRSLRTFRRPLPLPLPAAQFPLVIDPNGRACLHLRLWHPSDPPLQKQFTIRLEYGPDFLWHQECLAKAASGEMRRGAASLWRGKRGDTMLGIPVHIPVEKIKRPIKNALLVRTGPEALLTVEIEGKRRSKPFILNEDWLRQRIIRHSLFRQRFSEDMRNEVRRDRQFRRNHYRALESRCITHNACVDDRLHKATRSVADFAFRNRVALVIYDDRDRSYVDPFPWARLKSLLKEKLEERAVEFFSREEA